MSSGWLSSRPSLARSAGRAGRAELAELDAERNDIDIRRCRASQLGRAAILAEREDRVETAIEHAAIRIADPAAARSPTGAAEEFRQRPLDIDGREIGHVGRDQRGFGMALAMADRRPRQIVGVLALDQVGPELLERRADGAVAQQQAVMRACRERAATRSSPSPPALPRSPHRARRG